MIQSHLEAFSSSSVMFLKTLLPPCLVMPVELKVLWSDCPAKAFQLVSIGTQLAPGVIGSPLGDGAGSPAAGDCFADGFSGGMVGRQWLSRLLMVENKIFGLLEPVWVVFEQKQDWAEFNTSLYC